MNPLTLTVSLTDQTLNLTVKRVIHLNSGDPDAPMLSKAGDVLDELATLLAIARNQASGFKQPPPCLTDEQMADDWKRLRELAARPQAKAKRPLPTHCHLCGRELGKSYVRISDTESECCECHFMVANRKPLDKSVTLPGSPPHCSACGKFSRLYADPVIVEPEDICRCQPIVGCCQHMCFEPACLEDLSDHSKWCRHHALERHGKYIDYPVPKSVERNCWRCGRPLLASEPNQGCWACGEPGIEMKKQGKA